MSYITQYAIRTPSEAERIRDRLAAQCRKQARWDVPVLARIVGGPILDLDWDGTRQLSFEVWHCWHGKRGKAVVRTDDNEFASFMNHLRRCDEILLLDRDIQWDDEPPVDRW